MKCDRIATVGTFDGVHKGHRIVLETLSREGETRGLKPLVFTFDRHPLTVVAPEKAPGMLTLPQERDEILTSRAFEVETIRFDEAIASMSAMQWMEKMGNDYSVKALVIGYDNTFGHDGVTLSIEDYRKLGESVGVEIIEAPVVEGVSSSVVRKAVASGDVGKAAELLERSYSITGIVVHGSAVGRSIGWPTANLQPDPRLLIPATGVYAAFCEFPDGRKYPAMVNIGIRPTFGDGGKKTIEAHLIDFSGSLYSLPMRIHFVAGVRDEKKFSSLDELKGALSVDKENVMSILKPVL